jgi:nucleotide-binding universal stress UspA family protein
LRGPVLIGLDGRPASHDALELATGLCEQAGASLIAAYVPQNEHPFTPYDQPYQRDLRDLVDGLREDIAPALGRVPNGRRREIRAFHAVTAAAGLHELAAAERARLMVVGSSHHTPLGRVLVGSTAASLLVDAPCPVAVAPRGLSGRDARPLRTVGVALDGCRSSEVALGRARDLAEDLGAELVALSVAPHHGVPQSSWHRTRRQMASQTDALLERAGATGIERLMLGGPTVGALSRASEDLDLLVVGCRETGGVAGHPTLRSVSRRLLRTSACPVVAVPERLMDRSESVSPGTGVARA